MPQSPTPCSQWIKKTYLPFVVLTPSLLWLHQKSIANNIGSFMKNKCIELISFNKRNISKMLRGYF